MRKLGSQLLLIAWILAIFHCQLGFCGQNAVPIKTHTASAHDCCGSKKASTGKSCPGCGLCHVSAKLEKFPVIDAGLFAANFSPAPLASLIDNIWLKNSAALQEVAEIIPTLHGPPGAAFLLASLTLSPNAPPHLLA